MSKILISITGPTGIGKTKLAILVAKHLNTEIISADSRQFFKEMTIGTAVPSIEELEAIPHHFIQHRNISEKYSVGDFERDAIVRLEELFKTKECVIMVGGSGLYSDAVTTGLDKFPEVDPTIRTELNRELRINGIDALQKKLMLLDADYFEKVDINNPHRLIRALEICIGTGKPYSSYLGKKKPQRNFKVLSIG
ncbi:MAG: tRNA (adenosine(37)-N6)-dimethylallyltransferase MiaA, partial [Maribacter sp.]